MAGERPDEIEDACQADCTAGGGGFPGVSEAGGARPDGKNVTKGGATEPTTITHETHEAAETTVTPDASADADVGTEAETEKCLDQEEFDREILRLVAGRQIGELVALVNRQREMNPDLRINLRGADLIGANLCEADLRGADLSEADLSEADLRGADLSEAKGLTVPQLSGALGLSRVMADAANIKIVHEAVMARAERTVRSLETTEAS